MNLALALIYLRSGGSRCYFVHDQTKTSALVNYFVRELTELKDNGRLLHPSPRDHGYYWPRGSVDAAQGL